MREKENCPFISFRWEREKTGGEPTLKTSPSPARNPVIWEKPTNVNNVETLANIPIILTKERTGLQRLAQNVPKEPKCLLLPERLIMSD